MDLYRRLQDMVREAPQLMAALVAARQLGLESWCIGAGAVRTLVWDALHGFEKPSVLEDIDVVFFEASSCHPACEAELERQLTALMPGPCWDVTNQATVHQWFLERHEQVVPPARSLEDGVSTWPEFATCVGVSLRADDSLHIVAPHGLEDLFALRVRHNPVRASAATYRQRVEQKRYAQRWPRLEVIPAADPCQMFHR
jgi:hypothetical protein